MTKNSSREKTQYTSAAGLCATAIHLESIGFWKPIEKRVHIPQKTVRYTPFEKLKTVICLFMAGGNHVVETNKLIRSDEPLCRAVGCAPCDQSVVQDTLSSCTPETVEQFRAATREIFQRFGRAMRHRFSKGLLILDLDFSGLTCGRKAEGATKGYFAHRRNKVGRQLGRALASQYDEVVCNDVYAGTEQLGRAVSALVQAAASVLDLTPAKKTRTLIRTDGGGGTKEDILWLNAEGYRFITKVYAWHTAKALARKVQRWIDDPRTPGRQVGLVPQGDTGYPPGVMLVGLRFMKDNGKYGGATIATNLSAKDAIALAGWPACEAEDADRVALACTLIYDKRGGGIETAFKEDKQGLALGKCNKRLMAAQQMITGSIALAHNITVWARAWLAEVVPDLSQFGIFRMVRDILAVRGCVTTRKRAPILITFSVTYPYVNKIHRAFQGLLDPHLATLHLGEI